jgi:hypothetical protein
MAIEHTKSQKTSKGGRRKRTHQNSFPLSLHYIVLHRSSTHCLKRIWEAKDKDYSVQWGAMSWYEQNQRGTVIHDIWSLAFFGIFILYISSVYHWFIISLSSRDDKRDGKLMILMRHWWDTDDKLMITGDKHTVKWWFHDNAPWVQL